MTCFFLKHFNITELRNVKRITNTDLLQLQCKCHNILDFFYISHKVFSCSRITVIEGWRSFLFALQLDESSFSGLWNICFSSSASRVGSKLSSTASPSQEQRRPLSSRISRPLWSNSSTSLEAPNTSRRLIRGLNDSQCL